MLNWVFWGHVIITSGLIGVVLGILLAWWDHRRTRTRSVSL